MRLIDADLANVDSISCFYGDRAYLDDVQEWLNDQPTIDPVKHGKWEKHLLPLAYKCSCCGMRQGAKAWNFDSKKYCPECGAKMDLGEELDET